MKCLVALKLVPVNGNWTADMWYRHRTLALPVDPALMLAGHPLVCKFLVK